MKLPKELHEKKELGSTTGKNKSCTIGGCKKLAIRSLSESKWKDYLKKASLKYVENRAKKIYLCKEHYKDVKKEKQKDEKYAQKKGFLDDVAPFRRDGF
ncbi:MAG: hypothetical protein KGD63_14860 [Candidatus Lokiarchaeota archaeon]|nr:hypothetical protein [Candidatus Lokiarchaeota archaeon]